MFDKKEFFPTPIWLIIELLKPYFVKKKVREHSGFGNRSYEYTKKYYDIGNKIILEPSAGRGDIVDFITGSYITKSKEQKQKAGLDEHYNDKSAKSIDSSNVYCIEQDMELRYILNKKGYRVIAGDFLTFKPDNHFDIILMNPPFSNGDQHLLKAWEILETGEVHCILNAETIRNPYTEKRQLLARIIEQYGSFEYLKDQFVDAERTTNVEIAIVRLKKVTEKSKFDFDFKSVPGTEKGFEIDDDPMKNLPETKDIVGNMILQFEKTKEAFIEFLKAKEQLSYYGDALTHQNEFSITTVESALTLTGTKKEQYNTFCDWVRAIMWSKVVTKLNVDQLMTTKIRKNFEDFRNQQGDMQFTKENVQELIDMLFTNQVAILERAIIEVFDNLTEHHQYNRMIMEGWKTNSAWKVNRKVIFPYGCCFDKDWYNKGYSTSFRLHHNYDTGGYSDIDKVLAYISGRDYNTQVRTISEALDHQFRYVGALKKGHDKFDNTCQSTFFDIKFWKKGTVHIVFRDVKLWEEFNMRACAFKKWLPWEEEEQWRESKNKKNPKPKEKPVKELLQIEAPVEEVILTDRKPKIPSLFDDDLLF